MTLGFGESFWLKASMTLGFGESFWLKASKIGGRRDVPLSNYTLAFALQLRKITETLSHGSRVVLDYTSGVELVAFLGAASAGLLNISPPRLPVGDFSQLWAQVPSKLAN
jgi:hypothetical protein